MESGGKTILSVSRRCDVPAWGMDGFLRAIERGYVDVPNPFNPGRIRRVSLEPGRLGAVVFWSKNPGPLLERLGRLLDWCPRVVVLYTVTGYPSEIEPGLPPLGRRIELFRGLAEMLGPERVVWRYDPILPCDRFGPDFHIRNFERLAGLLAPSTRRLVTSFYDSYRRADGRLAAAGVKVCTDARQRPEWMGLLSLMARSAKEAGIEPQLCAEPAIAGVEIPSGACIDAGLLERQFGVPFDGRKDSGQRKPCLCSRSVDVGVYGTCRTGCLYCYACR